MRRLGPRANPGNLPPPAGLAMWAFYAGRHPCCRSLPRVWVMSVLCLSEPASIHDTHKLVVRYLTCPVAVCCAAYMWHLTGPSGAPGLPAWQTPPDTLRAVMNESINLFYINIGLAAVHLNPLPAVASHPVSEASHSHERIPLHRKLYNMFYASPAAHCASTVSRHTMPLQALFNVVIAWSLMLGPLMLSDRKAANVPRKWPLYIGTLVSRLLLQQMPHQSDDDDVVLHACRESAFSPHAVHHEHLLRPIHCAARVDASAICKAAVTQGRPAPAAKLEPLGWLDSCRRFRHLRGLGSICAARGGRHCGAAAVPHRQRQQ